MFPKRISSVIDLTFTSLLETTSLNVATLFRSSTKKHLLWMFLLVFSVTLSAETIFKVNGIMYFVTGENTVAVTSGGDYTGSITIPQTVKHLSKVTYHVTAIGDYAFSHSATLSTITIPNSVDSIGEKAFSNCSILTKVVLPDSVATIGKYAFQNSPLLTTIAIPNTITTIPEGMFYSCSGLTEINIPSSVTSIADYSFAFCTGLKTLNITDTITSIGNNSFGGCTGLTEIHDYSGAPASILANTFSNVDKSRCTLYVPIGFKDKYNTANLWMDFKKIVEQGAVVGTRFNVDGIYYEVTGYNTVAVTNDGHDYTPVYSGNVTVPAQVSYNGITFNITSIGSYSFSGCRNLISINIPSSVTSIGYSSFSGCKSLTSIIIPSGVVSIGSYAFSSCNSLASINIPSGVTSIESYSFPNCSSLTSINIPSGVTSIGIAAFSNCTSLISISLPDGLETIEETTFYGCNKLTSINIPSSVTSIGKSTFKSCTSLVSVNIPFGITSIEPNTFYECTSLTSINIPSSVTSIAYDAFNSCSSLTSINIPSGVTLIDNAVFYGCSNLQSLNIPSGVTIIGSDAFNGCVSLTSINIPSGVTIIGSSAFSDCSSLTSINIPSGVTSIGSYAFGGCRGLTSITIPSGVTSIKDGIFLKCSNLTSIDLPTSLTSIGGLAFSGCSSLTSINIPSGVTSIGNAFIDCTSLTSITMPSGLTSIESYTFNSCSSLYSITIPSSVTSIGSLAFLNCSKLKSLTLLSNLSSIGTYSFGGCSSLADIYCYAPNPAIIYHNVFSGVDTTNCKLYVRSKSLPRYRGAAVWRSFANILPLQYEVATPNLKVLTNTDFSIPVSSSAIYDTDSVSAFQMELKYDSTRMVYKGYDADTTFTNHGSILLNSDTKGVLKLGYMSDNYFAFEGDMLNLHFKSQKSGVRVTDFTKFLLNTENALYTQKGKVEIMGYGDVDYNQEVQSFDASLALIKSVGLNPLPDVDALPWEELRMDVADVDGNESVTAYDAGLILKKSVDLIATFPVEDIPVSLIKSNKAKADNAADVWVTIEGKSLVFRSSGNLTGLNLSFSGEVNILKAPVVTDKNALVAKNIQNQTYNVAMAFGNAPVDGSIIMTIPLNKDSVSDLTANMIINQQEKVVSITSNASGVSAFENKNPEIWYVGSSDKLHVAAAGNYYSLTIVDLTGKVVLNTHVSTNAPLSLSSIKSSGMYVVKVITENGKQLITRIIK